MSFFEDLGKKISRAGEVTVEKSKQLTNIAVVSSKISEAERKRDKFYKELGEKYFNLYGQAPAENLKDVVEKIRGKNVEIDQLKIQLEDIKGGRKCPSCGEFVDQSAAFCPKCGAKLKKEKEESKPVSQVIEMSDEAPEPEENDAAISEEDIIDVEVTEVEEEGEKKEEAKADHKKEDESKQEDDKKDDTWIYG